MFGDHFPPLLASSPDPAVLDLPPHLICSNSPSSSPLPPKEQKLHATSYQPLPRLKRHNPNNSAVPINVNCGCTQEPRGHCKSFLKLLSGCLLIRHLADSFSYALLFQLLFPAAHSISTVALVTSPPHTHTPSAAVPSPVLPQILAVHGKTASS